MHAKRTAMKVLAVLAVLPVVSCGSLDNSALDVAVIGGADDPFESGIRLSVAGQLARAATVEGLVAFDEEGRVIPALADRWIVTDDGQSYIFRLRDGNWANGDEITADSARQALNGSLKQLGKTPLALDLSGIDEIRTMASRVIEIRLKRPMPYLLQLLAQPELGLYHDKQGAGPMTLEKAEGLARMTPVDPAKLGLPSIENWDSRTRQIILHAISGPEAVERFNDGDVDLVLGGRIEDFLLTRSVGILRGTIQIDPVIGLFGLQVMNDRGFLADPANREALAMAVDRDALMKPFGVGGWSSTTRIVTPSLEGDLGTIGERWAGQSLDERRQVAAGRVRNWTSGKPGQAIDEAAADGAVPATPTAKLQLWLPEGDGSQVLFNKLAADFATIGIALARTQDQAAADLALVDDVARYPRAAWFLNRLSCAARRGLCSQEADARVAEAETAATPTDRAALLTEAEAELTSANVFIPFGTPIRWSLVRGSVSGFSPNAWGWHPLMPLAWLPK
ncbi:ABC transporter substrate-binding protein [Novosphingobium album (ex Hu et al. 2023)]|uniref:ABC transporter substrate-binding protein n=1 Tax=Novosphingobium album (ex Hu et al. 2023) TaxID=2930093 RepID=A0ABT0B167_9SPHN|nr:ABC transporter substrate-binding protein [Novosphingobium album (ex Hu et al. 2023)]MCJ2178650.1 ABC transporter substrate-binding protein [Novosphingobium album (ex Hu et al. 2023)]